MKSIMILPAVLAVAWVAVGAIGQSRPASANDPRVGLKPGYKDAGVAARNLELVKSFPKPDGFFDPKSPLGTPTPPERPAEAENANNSQPPAAQPANTAPVAARRSFRIGFRKLRHRVRARLFVHGQLQRVYRLLH